MQYFAIALALLVWVITAGKTAQLERKINRLKHRLREKGGSNMARLMDDLKGQRCRLQSYEGTYYDDGVTEMGCTILDSDTEWVKITFIDKKGRNVVRAIHVDDIQCIEILDDPFATVPTETGKEKKVKEVKENIKKSEENEEK